jgi:hypothetical protein
MAVRQTDMGDAFHNILEAAGITGAGNEGIEQDSLVRELNLEGGMTVPGDAHREASGLPES